MDKNLIIEACGYKPTPIGGLTALGENNGRGGISPVLFSEERGINIIKVLTEKGLECLLRRSGCPKRFHVAIR